MESLSSAAQLTLSSRTGYRLAFRGVPAAITHSGKREMKATMTTATATATATATRTKSPLGSAAKIARRDRIVLEHLPLVKAIAIRVHENLPVHVDLDDLVHAGVLGLFDAASKFDPEKQVAFSSYAKHRIKGAILDS